MVLESFFKFQVSSFRFQSSIFNFQFSIFNFLLPDDVADEAGEGDGSGEDQRKERGQAADGVRDEGNHRDRTTDTLNQRPPDILCC